MAAPAEPWLQNELSVIRGRYIGAPPKVPGVSANNAAKAFLESREEQKKTEVPPGVSWPSDVWTKALEKKQQEIDEAERKRQALVDAKEERKRQSREDAKAEEFRVYLERRHYKARSEQSIFIKTVLEYMPEQWDADSLVNKYGANVYEMMEQYHKEGGVFEDTLIREWLKKDNHCNWCIL